MKLILETADGAVDLDLATGVDLDKIAAWYGVPERGSLTDAEYRQKIIERTQRTSANLLLWTPNAGMHAPGELYHGYPLKHVFPNGVTFVGLVEHPPRCEIAINVFEDGRVRLTLLRSHAWHGWNMDALPEEDIAPAVFRPKERTVAAAYGVKPSGAPPIYFVLNGLFNGEDGVRAETTWGALESDGWYYLREGDPSGRGPFRSREAAERAERITRGES